MPTKKKYIYANEAPSRQTFVLVKAYGRRLEDILKMSSKRLGRRKIITLKTSWRLGKQEIFSGLHAKRAHKVIMKRSKLRKIFLKHRTDTNKKNYRNQKKLYKNIPKNIPKPKYFSIASENLVMSVINSFDKHPSIAKIKTKALNSTFHFKI